MDAATHPGAGQLYARALVTVSEYEEASENIDALSATLKLVYGIQSNLALLGDVTYADLSASGNDESGVLASTFQVKYRLFKRDFSPLNTWMASAFAGLTVPGDVGMMDGLDPYPRLSLATTAILTRHGLNGELEWEACDDDPQRFNVNGSYLFRIKPVDYSVTTQGAWYLMLESLNQFTDEGDSRFDMAGGILYEARRWACEASLRFPVAQDWQREDDYQLTIGFRFLP